MDGDEPGIVWGTPIGQNHYVEGLFMVFGIGDVHFDPVGVVGCWLETWQFIPTENSVVEFLIEWDLSINVASLNECFVTIHGCGVDSVGVARDFDEAGCW